MNQPIFLGFSEAQYALVTAMALSAACAVLSVVVVLRRWAFIGEGISHSGFGGIGTAWLLSLLVPALASEIGVYALAVVFCLGVALGIGFFSRRQRLSTDVTIGVFLVASLSWGFMSLSIYSHARPELPPPSWERYLLGDMTWISAQTMMSAVCISAAVVVLFAFLQKEIFAYAFDPALAEVSGVRAGLIHYLLLVLLAMLILIGMGLVGNLLIPALLVLPGAAALLVSQRLRSVMALSVTMGILAAAGGWCIHRQWPFLPSGPSIVLVLFGEFLLAYAWSKIRREE